MIALIPLFLGASAAAVAPAAVEIEERAELGVDVSFAWPDEAHQGYVPVRVRVTNRAERARTLEITATNNMMFEGNAETRQALTLDAGARAEVELLLPGFLEVSAASTIAVLERGRRLAWTPVDVGPAQWPVWEMRHALLLVEAEPREDIVDGWEALLNDESSDDEVPDTGRGALGYRILNLTAAPASMAPRHPAAWSSIDVIVLDAALGLPGAEALGPVMTAVRQGGSLLVLGPEPERAVASIPGLGDWTEARFSQAGSPGGDAWSVGLGVVQLIATDEGLADPVARAALAGLLMSASDHAWVPSPGNGRLEQVDPTLPGHERTPLGTFAGLMIALGVLLGPVNLLVARWSGRSSALLVTTPVIAVGASVVLVTWGLVRGGIQDQVSRFTLAVLDQRTGLATVEESRALFLARARADGLPVGAGAALFPRGGAALGATGVVSGLRYEATLTDGWRLAGDMADVRRPLLQLRQSERASRVGLTIRGGGDEITARNDLGVTVDRLAICGADGRRALFTEPLGPGEERAGRAAEPDELADAVRGWTRSGVVEGVSEASRARLLPWGSAVPAGTWIARVEASPFADEAGAVETSGEHWILGVLGEAP